MSELEPKHFIVVTYPAKNGQNFGPMEPKIFLHITFVIKVSHTKFDINRMTNVRVRAKSFHCSNLARQKWTKFWPYGPQNISLHYFCHKSLSNKI